MSVVDFPLVGTIGTSLKPKRFDIELYQGDTFNFDLLLKAAGVPADLTGWTTKAQIRKQTDNTAAETPLLRSTIPTPSNGKIRIALTATETAALGKDTVYKYDIECTDSASNVRTFIGGKITITEDVTE